MGKCWLFAVVLFFLFSLRSYSQNVSNEGTDFWAVFPTHVPSGNNLAALSVFVTSKVATEVTVSCGLYSDKKTIPANVAVEFVVQRDQAYINDNESNQLLTNRGIHIKVTDGKPKVSAYAHIWGRQRSAASLILPFETLGQTYYAMNFTQSAGGKNYMVLMAVEDDTSILLHEKNGSVIPVTLAKAGDVYEYMSGSSDLTGVYAETDPAKSSCKRFSAFSGSSVISIGCTSSADPLYQQLYPTVSWGRNYGVVPFINRRFVLRILAQADNTKVSYGGQTFTLNKGQFHESGYLTEPTFVSADNLISVAQFAFSQNCSSASGGAIIGDPEMVILNPIEFSIKTVTVFSSDLERILEKYLNILIKTNKANTFKVNDVAPNVTWTPLSGNNAYSFAQIPVSANSLTLTAEDGFNAIAYGFGSAESYSYSAGTNLSSNNYLTVVNQLRNEEGQNGCIGSTVDFKVNLPYQPDRITWTLEGGAEEVMLNPVPEVKTVNGQTTYVYSYPINKIYTVPGEYHLEVVAHVPNNASNCTSGNLQTNYVFTIYKLPTADFETVLTSCASSEVEFKDKSISNEPDFSVTNWLWDFKDGTTSTDQNPKHKFLQEGKYKVTLTAKSGAACYSDLVEKEIEIYPLPVSKFSAPAQTCINTLVSFRDESTISNLVSINNIKGWRWDFGDGSTPSNEQHPTHTYTAPGKYTVKLVTTSGRDCVSIETAQEIVVTDLPKADFTMPEICLRDAIATFTNISANVSGGVTGLTYKWDFGDRFLSNALASTNFSAAKDGVHSYTVAADYQVKLTITNANGCTVEKTQTFTVNGSVTKASFEVLASNTFCSDQIVSIKNTSTVDFGKITKIEVYKDNINHPEMVETFDQVIPLQIDLKYDVFGAPATKDYQIKLVAHSGGTCFDLITKTVTLKAIPVLTVDEIPAICEMDGVVSVAPYYHESAGIAGKGVFSSPDKGLSSDGTYDPKLAGAGSHNITYTFDANNGCSSSITKTIVVYKSPEAYVEPIFYILAGGELALPATAEGNDLTYKWTPALGLSSDKVLNPVANPDQDTEYSLTVTTNPDGCQTTTKVMVKVLQAVMPPNTFTPNGDNVNDVWNIKYLDTYPKATIEVFTRNGTRVFYSEGYKIPFDGTFQNEALPVGVYYYVINPRNGRKTVTGPLTIIR